MRADSYGTVEPARTAEIARAISAGGPASRSRGGSGLQILAAHMIAGLGGMEQGGAARGPERAGLAGRGRYGAGPAGWDSPRLREGDSVGGEEVTWENLERMIASERDDSLSASPPAPPAAAAPPLGRIASGAICS